MTAHQLTDLPEKVCVALKAAFSELLAANADQNFYAFALFTDDSLQFLHPMANSHRNNGQQSECSTKWSWILHDYPFCKLGRLGAKVIDSQANWPASKMQCMKGASRTLEKAWHRLHRWPGHLRASTSAAIVAAGFVTGKRDIRTLWKP